MTAPGSHDDSGANLGVRPGTGVDVADCVAFLGLAQDRVLLDPSVLSDTHTSVDQRIRSDPRTGTDLDAAHCSFGVGRYEDRIRVHGYLLAEQEQARPRQLNRAYSLTWREYCCTHLHHSGLLGAVTASTAVMRRQGKTIWQGAAVACTVCKHACTQREMRLWSKGMSIRRS